jgi:indole-3-glycerol phosphate synthase
MNVLETIVAQRRKDVEDAKRRVPVGRLKELAATRHHHSLLKRLQDRNRTHIIAEMKKASPSAGVLRDDYRPAEIAAAYAKAGASGISVLTEPHRFLGSKEHLHEVRDTVDLPLLRKDFICDVYQVHETAAWRADVILLIVAALDKSLLQDLYETSMGYGLEVLVEAHTKSELDTAISLEKAIIGVNSRNLKTLKTDLATARELAKSIPKDRVAIAESGIKTRDDIDMLEKAGYRGFLIGEAIMTAGDPGRILNSFLGKQA